MLRYVITGCMRSGTTFASRLLTQCGMSCGHERVFDSWTDDYRPVEKPPGVWSGDSSFIAAPAAKRLAARGLVVVHLVRAPLDVIGSIIGNNLLTDMDQPYARFIAHHAPAVADEPSSVRRAARYWLEWNRLIEPYAHLRWNTAATGPVEVLQLAGRLRFRVIQHWWVEPVVRRVPRDVNAAASPVAVALEELGDLAAEVEQAAGRYCVPLTTGVC